MFGKNKEKNKIDLLLKEIRGEYDKLVMNYSRPRSIAKQFDLRYHDAVEYRLDLMKFLEAEREAVKTLLEQAENRINTEKTVVKPARGASGRSTAGKPASTVVENTEERISFADRLIQEFAERIEKYPEIIIHPDAAYEIKKLFGALSCVEKDYWSTVDRIIRNITGSKRFRDSIDLDPEINRMCITGTEGIPSALGTYHRLLERLPRDYKEVEREEKRCLVSAAGLLKKLQMEIIKALDSGSGNLEDEEKQKLTEAKVYIDGMIDDFRLRDLARLN